LYEISVNNRNYVVSIGDDFYTFTSSTGTDPKFTLVDTVSGVVVTETIGTGFHFIVNGVEEVVDTTKIALFNCDSGVCTRTAGYITDDGTNYYSVTEDASASPASASDCTSTDGDVGKLKSDGNLCLALNIPVGMPEGTTKFYLIKNPQTGSAFATYSSNTIIVRATQTTFSYENVYKGKRRRINNFIIIFFFLIRHYFYNCISIYKLTDK